MNENANSKQWAMHYYHRSQAFEPKVSTKPLTGLNETALMGNSRDIKTPFVRRIVSRDLETV